jgi:hypothetical protein
MRKLPRFPFPMTVPAMMKETTKDRSFPLLIGANVDGTDVTIFWSKYKDDTCIVVGPMERTNKEIQMMYSQISHGKFEEVTRNG